MNIFQKLGLNEKPSKQELFDYICVKLHEQGGGSFKTWEVEGLNSCITQTTNGKRCAMGMLLFPALVPGEIQDLWSLLENNKILIYEREFFHGLRMFLHDLHVENRSFPENEIAVKANCGFVSFEEWMNHHGIADTRPKGAWFNKEKV